MIQLDFGELSLLKDEVAENINEKVWLKRVSFKLLPDGEIKECFKEIMKKNLTLEQLDKY